MMVYGDRERRCAASDAARALRVQLARASERPDSLSRRARWARVLIDTGIFAQALLDLEFARLGSDALTPLSSAAHRTCFEAGRGFLAAHLARPFSSDSLARALEELEGLVPDRELRLRDPEGYAFYALYPELYVEAALALPRQDVQVIGIRSIGTSLAGLVAAALDATRPPITVRPTGHPFARTLSVSTHLERALFTAPADRFAIVDEGPGLSGSSFAAVQRYLEAHHVRREQVVLFPSHNHEPGERASDALRACYRQTERAVLSFDAYFDGSNDARAPHRWFSDLTGPLSEPAIDFSAGRWRAHAYPDASHYPPSYARDERRKYFLQTNRGAWLLKFSGLGSASGALAERARMLSDAGFTPAWRAARHGFTLTRFEREAVPLPRATLPRALLVSSLARYLAFLASHFRVPADRGADVATLLALSQRNAEQLFGPDEYAGLARHAASVRELAPLTQPVTTDSKLDAYEWLVQPDGRLLKCDAEDHHAGHDCIGCQDPAWDIAGATVELELSLAEREVLLAALFDAAGLRFTEQKLAFYELAYCAFRAGRADFAEQAARGWADEDAARLARERARYAARLRALLVAAE